MPTVSFTQNLQRHVACPEMTVGGVTVREALENVFASHPQLRGYILDDQNCLHKHMAIILNGTAITDRAKLNHTVSGADQLYIMQTLSGG